MSFIQIQPNDGCQRVGLLWHVLREPYVSRPAGERAIIFHPLPYNAPELSTVLLSSSTNLHSSMPIPDSQPVSVDVAVEAPAMIMIRVLQFEF